MILKTLLVLVAFLMFAGTAVAQTPLTIKETLVSFTPNGFASDSILQINAVEGNSYVYTGSLRDSNGRVGSSSGACAVLNAGLLSCQVTFRLPSGKLLLAGTANSRKADVLPLLGGSGLFASQHGSVRVQSTSWVSGLVRNSTTWTVLGD